MIDSIRIKLKSILASIAGINLSEADASSGPYVVYDLTTAPVLSKDGIESYRGDAKFRIVGRDIDTLDVIRASVESAIASGMRDGVFGSFLLDITKECVEDLWTIELNYTLKQYADWVQPSNTNNE